MAARQFPLQRLMELETDERCGTAPAADARRSESGCQRLVAAAVRAKWADW